MFLFASGFGFMVLSFACVFPFVPETFFICHLDVQVRLTIHRVNFPARFTYHDPVLFGSQLFTAGLCCSYR